MHWQGSNPGVSQGYIYSVAKEIEPPLASAWDKLRPDGIEFCYA